MSETVRPIRNDLDAMQDVAARYREVLRRYFERRRLTGADADDAVQEVFAKLAQRANLVEIETIEAYIFEIAANVVTDHFRRSVSRRSNAHDEYDDSLHASEDFSPDGARLRVTLIEGRVKVSEADLAPQQAPQTNMILTPGEELDERVGQSMLVTRADLAKVQSWKDGLVVFEDEPLSQAVAELNRYSAKPIVIGDLSISNLRVTGVFNTDQSDRFAQILTETFPLSATYDSATGAVLRRRAAS